MKEDQQLRGRVNTDFVTAAIEGHLQDGGVVLVDAPSSLKDDKEAVLQAVRLAPRAIRMADSKYRKDQEVMLAVVSQNGRMLKEAADSIKDDPIVVTAAVKQFGQALEFASLGLRARPEIVLAAVAQDGYAIQYALGGLQGAMEVCAVAVAERPMALRMVDPALRLDESLVRLALAKNGMIIGYPFMVDAREAHWQPAVWRELVLLAVTQDGRALQYAGAALQADKHVIMAAVSESFGALEFVAEAFKNQAADLLCMEPEEWLAAQTQVDVAKGIERTISVAEEDEDDTELVKGILLRQAGAKAATKLQAVRRGTVVRRKVKAMKTELARETAALSPEARRLVDTEMKAVQYTK